MIKNLKVLTDTLFTEDMSTLFYIPCTTGFLGTFLYFNSIISNIRKKDYFIKLMVYIYFFGCIFNNLILQSSSVIYLLLIFSDSIIENNSASKYKKDGEI